MPWRPYAATCDASGVATIEITPRGSYIWVVQQVAVEMLNPTAGASCSIRLNDWLVTPVVAAGDAAGGDPPIDVGPGDLMTVVFRGGIAGRVCRATVFYIEKAV